MRTRDESLAPGAGRPGTAALQPVAHDFTQRILSQDLTLRGWWRMYWRDTKLAWDKAWDKVSNNISSLSRFCRQDSVSGTPSINVKMKGLIKRRRLSARREEQGRTREGRGGGSFGICKRVRRILTRWLGGE